MVPDPDLRGFESSQEVLTGGTNGLLEMDGGDWFLVIFLGVMITMLTSAASCVSGKETGKEIAYEYMCEQKCGPKYAVNTNGAMKDWVCNCPTAELDR